MVSKDFDLTKLNTFPKLLDYLRVELDWPIEDDNLDDATYDYTPQELGIEEKYQINIKSIKQLMPLTSNQPWGIFFIDFDTKKLPIVLLRRLLTCLKIKKTNQSPSQPTWNLDDLLFVSLLGEEKNRQVCFSHFKETEKGLPILQTFSWDETETHLYYLKKFNLESLRWPGDVNNSDEWKTNWTSAFTAFYGEAIKNSKELSIELAKIAKSIKHTVNEIYTYETDNGHYHKLLAMFKEALIHDLESDDFSDMVAQTVTYGLFSAAATGEELTGLNNLSDLIPNTNPFLKDLFDELTTVSTTNQKVNFDELGLNDLLDILNKTNMDVITQQFGRQTGGGSEDPVIHFYEDFLDEYDKVLKKKLGVYYTKPSIVSFIVRSVDEMLKKEFNLNDGLADISTWAELVTKNPGMKKPPSARFEDYFVNILDPATGTGTFIVEVIDLVYNTMISKWEKIGKNEKDIKHLWNDYVNDHLIPRIYGFELMMAPYSICQVKIGLKLKETGFDINNAKNRFNIFLSNTLEEPQDLEMSMFKPFLAIENDEANRVKMNIPITVIIGNPPYSVSSSNKGKWIQKLIESYKQNLNEKKINLDDDYIKFIRYGEHLLERSGHGILAYISNNSFIDGITHREMRRNIIKTFNEINILDLHGSIKKKEKDPKGGKDENVFDKIQQGVSISLFIKNNSKKSNVYHTDLYGTRAKKYDFLLQNSIRSIDQHSLEVSAPNYFFVPWDYSKEKEYDKGIKITNLYKNYNSGIQTKRDGITINEEIKDLKQIIFNFKNLSISELKNKYNLPKDGRDWKIEWAIKDLKNNNPEIKNILYRPFDNRYTAYTGKSRGFIGYPRHQTMKHFFNGDNYGLITVRQQSTYSFQHILVTDTIMESGAISLQTKEWGYIFPLYLNNENSLLNNNSKRSPNLRMKIIRQLEENLRINFNNEKEIDDKSFSPIDLMDYIYAVLHSYNYREKYQHLLKIGFPKVPFTASLKLFWKLVKFGEKLRNIHLFQNSSAGNETISFEGNGDNVIGKFEYNEGRVSINKDQHFDGVPELAWKFYIGGYQPAQKWIKDRNGRKLSTEDIEHYQKIIVALTETDRIMKEIDKVYPEVEKDLIEFKLDDLENKDKKKTEPDKNQKIFDLIEKGEGSTIEFKATLQKSIDNPNIPPTVIENNVIKSIAGFCNTEGGNLLIGVNDNGEIIGIEQDNFQSNDKFKNHLKNILDARVTKSVFSSIKTEFFIIEDKTVFSIECNKSDEPLYVNYEGDIHFYKRNLESTDSLNPQETMEYCKKRFK